MEEQLLKEIKRNTRSKATINLVVSGKENPITTIFKAPILLDKTPN